MAIDEIESGLTEALTQYWGDRATDFVSSKATDIPYQILTLEFTLYNFCLVRLTLERSTVWFAEVSKGVGLKLLPSPIHTNDVTRNLARIDAEVRLRIPDKYLEAKGW